MSGRMIRALALLVLTGVPLPAQRVDSATLGRTLDTLAERVRSDQGAPGLVLGVVRGGRLIYARGFGERRLGSHAPMTSRSLFHMASVTKPFVATAIVQLVEQGKVDLDQPVVRYLPYFRVKDPKSGEITIRQMLSHTSGMRDVTDYRWGNPEYDDGALERYVKGLADSTLLWPPGGKFRYSNIAFEVLADVIAKVSGRPFEDYVDAEILRPLGMRSSTLMKPRADTSLLTTPHVRGASRKAEVSAVFPYNRRHAASSTLLSNVEDMSRWAIANLRRGELDGRRILRAESYELLWTPRVDVGATQGPMAGARVGLSWFLNQDLGRRTVSHGGGDTGYRTFLVLAPDDQAAVVLMTNYDAVGAEVFELVRKALALAVGAPVPK